MPKEKNCIICGKKFTPYSSSQKQCGDEECKLEMFRRNSYSKREYKFSKTGLRKMWEKIGDDAYDLKDVKFTMDDLEKLK